MFTGNVLMCYVLRNFALILGLFHSVHTLNVILSLMSGRSVAQYTILKEHIKS